MVTDYTSPINVIRKEVRAGAKKHELSVEMITFPAKRSRVHSGLNIEGKTCAVLHRDKGFRSLFSQMMGKEVLFIGDGKHNPMAVVSIEMVFELFELRKKLANTKTKSKG